MSALCSEVSSEGQIGGQSLRPELREWLDVVIVLALVRAWLKESDNKRKSLVNRSDEIVKGMMEALQKERAALGAEEDQLLRRKATLERERTNLIDSIASGFNSESVRTAIIEREKEIDGINVSLAMAESKGAVPDFERLRDFAVSKISDLRVLLDKSENIPEFRNMLENRVGVIQMEPTEDNGIACYLAKGRLDFLTGEEQERWVGAAGRS